MANHFSKNDAIVSYWKVERCMAYEIRSTAVPDAARVASTGKRGVSMTEIERLKEEVERLTAENKRLKGLLDSHGISWQPVQVSATDMDVLMQGRSQDAMLSPPTQERDAIVLRRWQRPWCSGMGRGFEKRSNNSLRIDSFYFYLYNKVGVV